MESCPLCIENFNLSIHEKITCPYDDCAYSVCKSCVRTYLLGTTKDPHCMNCFKEWNDEFMMKSLNKSFYEKTYRKHRRQLLLEIEISKLPEAMIAAEKEKQVILKKEKMKIIQNQITEIQKELRLLNNNKVSIYNQIVNIQQGANTVDQARKFIMPCRNNNCRGFLSSQYKCDLCEMFTCPHCLELIGFNKSDPHVCKPEDVASAEMIKKDTKPCPKCGVRIHKIHGCDQMYCTQCKVAFSYKTLKIDTGQVHNPHFYEEQKLLNNGEVIRNPQDVLCGGLCTYPQLNRNIILKLRHFVVINCGKYNTENFESYLVLISDIHRTISHFTNYELPRKREMVRNIGNTEKLRVFYILGKKDEKPYNKEDLARDVFKNDVKRKKETKVLHIIELLSVFGIEMFNQFLATKDEILLIKLIINKLKEIENLRKYCNNQFSIISNTYSCSQIYITNNWKIHNKKYKKDEIEELS